MIGDMQSWTPNVAGIIEHAMKVHPKTEIISRLVSGEIHRSNYEEVCIRSRKLASVLIKDQDVKLLTDPWYVDGEFYGTWYNYPPCTVNLKELENIDGIYISHIHPDHYDPIFLRKLIARYGDVKILIPDHNPNYLLFKSKSDGFSVSPTRHLIQAGPFLVENDIAVGGLENQKRSPRSFLVWDGGSRWALGYADKASLAELATALAAQPVTQLDITTALNLDGGRSSDLWVSAEVPGGPLNTRTLWNRPVRNYLLLHRQSR